MTEDWFPEWEWKFVQDRVPIVCADVLPIRKEAGNRSEVGLILRDTPHQGRRWCLIGGRILLNESFRDAVTREVRQALGPAVEYKLPRPLEPAFIAQYFSEHRTGELFDPRQHAIGLTFAAEISGEISVGGEALDFGWYDVSKLPAEAEIGFGQDRVVAECVHRLGLGR